jgi:hypothetical protein
MKRPTAIAALLLLLAGCGFDVPIIKSQAVHYDDVIEDTTNKLLVLNVLRARDKAPLHFAAIPLIHESIQQTASAGVSVPFGRIGTTNTRDTWTVAGSLQMIPSFDVVHLNSKDFATGIASPIEPKFVKYWLDRGLDRRIILLLFFSSAEIVESDGAGHSRVIRIMNSPRDAIDWIRSETNAETDPAMRCDGLSDFLRYLKLINTLRTFYARAYTERRLLADNVPATKDVKELQSIAQLDPSRIEWVRNGNAYSLYAISQEPKIALCFFDANANSTMIGTDATTSRDRSGCFRSVVDVGASEAASAGGTETPVFHAHPAPGQPSGFCAQYNRFLGMETPGDAHMTRTLRLQIRSVGEIIQFLGDLLEYQDAIEQHRRQHPDAKLNLNTPVTFGYCPDVPLEERARSGCGDVFFNLWRSGCAGRFNVEYRGEMYAIAPHDALSMSAAEGACRPAAGAKDHTLEILSVVGQLVDLRKSANDIRATPYVQVLP